MLLQLLQMGTNGNHHVVFREDLEGRRGSSPLLASFTAPSHLLASIEPPECQSYGPKHSQESPCIFCEHPAGNNSRLPVHDSLLQTRSFVIGLTFRYPSVHSARFFVYSRGLFAILEHRYVMFLSFSAWLIIRSISFIPVINLLAQFIHF